MRPTSTCIFLLLASMGLHAQPYIVSSEGLGQYGYLEKDATTYVRLSSSNYSVKELAARWWISSEYIYYTGISDNCVSYDASTVNFASSNHPGWATGASVFVAVRYRDCSSNFQSCGSGSGCNERQFRVVDTDNTYSGGFDNLITDNPGTGDNLVGSFTLNAGATNLTLDRLWIQNTGNAQEGSDIANDGIRVYYEAITGSETFDGSESFRTLFGNYNGNSATNEEWGHDDLNIPVTTSGVRCYIVVSDLNVGFISGNTVLFNVINDGISFQESLNSFNKIRVNAFATATQSAPLPVNWLGFSATLRAQQVVLDWSTSSESGNRFFEVERSANGFQWESIAEIPAQPQSNIYGARHYTHTDQPESGQWYYRIRQTDFDGASTVSKVVSVRLHDSRPVRISPNPLVSDFLTLELPEHTSIAVVRLYDLQGREIRRWQPDAAPGTRLQFDLGAIQPGWYLVQCDQETAQLVYRQP
jgi:hypothetical protein